MLLRQLVDFRPTDLDPSDESQRPYSRERTARWELSIDTRTWQGQLTDLADASTKATKNGRPYIVPHANRAFGIAPNLGADDIQYVLGWADESSKPDRVKAAHAAFVELVSHWATDAPDDSIAAQLAEFYVRDGQSTVERPDRWKSKDVVVIKVDGRSVTTSDSLWRLWQRVVEGRKSGGTDGGGRHGLCLVCAQWRPLLNRMPQTLPKSLVPGADQEVALVSANRRIHTYDFSEGLSTAPICILCGQLAVANLHAVLSNDRHTFTYERQRTRLAWWVTHGGDPRSIEILDEDPAVIRDYLASVQLGRKPRGFKEKHTFCAVSVSGNAARLVVHDWLEMPLSAVEENVQAWFVDHETVQRATDEPGRFPLWRLVSCAGQFMRVPGQPHGRYIPIWDKAADRPDDLAEALWGAALSRRPLPSHILAHLTRRVSTDLRVDEARVALIRLALIRSRPHPVEGLMPGLDETRTDPPYVYGRIFAVLESLQYTAYRNDTPNTTFHSRYYAGAIANPAIAWIQGERLSAAWLRKLESSSRRAKQQGEENRDGGAAYALKARLDALSSLVRDVPRSRATTKDQGLFILGYHHQRSHDRQQARAGKAAGVVVEHPDSETPNGEVDE